MSMRTRINRVSGNISLYNFTIIIVCDNLREKNTIEIVLDRSLYMVTCINVKFIVFIFSLLTIYKMSENAVSFYDCIVMCSILDFACLGL